MEETSSILLARITPSKTNPRTDFDPAQQKELEKSIKESGLAQPVLLRPLGKDFELVSGERRFRAFKSLGIKEIPSYIRELNDDEAQSLQQIENLQRKDLKPLEEARGFATLSAGGKFPTSEIAAKTGKAPAYVLRRMRLMSLSPAAQKALTDGTLSLASAEELTRVTHHADQDALLNWNDNPWNKEGRAAVNPVEMRRLIEEKFLLELRRAPFPTDDAMLNVEAGPCTNCPKRTSAQGALFAGTEGKDLCLDGKCWSVKVRANEARLVEKHKGTGRKVLTGEAAAKAIKGLKALDSREFPLKNGVTYRKAFSGIKGFEPILAVDDRGKVHQLCRASDWIKKAPKNLIESWYFDRQQNGAQEKKKQPSPEQVAKLEASRKRGEAAAKLLSPMLTEAIDKAAPSKLDGKLLQLIGSILMDSVGDWEVQKRMPSKGQGSWKERKKAMAKGGKDLILGLVQAIASQVIDTTDEKGKIHYDSQFEELAEALSIDYLKLEKQVFEKLDAEEKAKAPKVKRSGKVDPAAPIFHRVKGARPGKKAVARKPEVIDKAEADEPEDE